MGYIRVVSFVVPVMSEKEVRGMVPEPLRSLLSWCEEMRPAIEGATRCSAACVATGESGLREPLQFGGNSEAAGPWVLQPDRTVDRSTYSYHSPNTPTLMTRVREK